jgi:hypothetical protein
MSKSVPGARATSIYTRARKQIFDGEDVSDGINEIYKSIKMQ